MFIGN